MQANQSGLLSTILLAPLHYELALREAATVDQPAADLPSVVHADLSALALVHRITDHVVREGPLAIASVEANNAHDAAAIHGIPEIEETDKHSDVDWRRTGHEPFYDGLSTGRAFSCRVEIN